MAPFKSKVDFAKQADQTSCLLLSLPAEIRNTIFEMVCSATTMAHRFNYFYRSFTERGYETGHIKPTPPGHILACKQIYSDSIGLLYTQATFEFYTRASVRSWNKNVDESKRALVEQARWHHY